MTSRRSVGPVRLERAVAAAVIAAFTASPVAAQNVQPLSLKDAEARALQNHPQVIAGQYAAQAGREAVREVRSAYFPAMYGSVTGAEAQSGSRIAAGGLNNPIILDRLAAGLSGSQMLTDFGRTSDLVQSSSLKSQALQQDVITDRAIVLLGVAQETVTERQLVVDQVSALAASALKSGLDVSFAKVNLGEAQLLLLQAQNDLAAAFASLAAALGQSDAPAYALGEEPLPPPPSSDGAGLVAQAMRERPDVAAERLAKDSARKFADAEHALWFPTISAVGAAGVAPYRQAGLDSRYSAAGVNVNVPLLNGSLFSARSSEANLRALAEEQRLRDLENRVAHDVRVALLEAQTAFQRLDVTNQILDQASQALDLAQARYGLGLSSIVELTQAQLNKTRAEIEQASARYDYQALVTALRYQIGTLK
jgi:outer membrane protein